MDHLIWIDKGPKNSHSSLVEIHITFYNRSNKSTKSNRYRVSNKRNQSGELSHFFQTSQLAQMRALCIIIMGKTVEFNYKLTEWLLQQLSGCR